MARAKSTTVFDSITPRQLAVSMQQEAKTLIYSEDGLPRCEKVNIPNADNHVLLLEVASAVKLFLSTDRPAYETRPNGLRLKNPWLNQLTTRLDHLLQAPHEKYICCPAIHAFFHAAEQAGLIPLTASDPETVNRFVDYIRKAMSSKVIDNEYRKLIRKSKDNFNSACLLIDMLFACYARLLVIRVDLHYQQQFAKAVSLKQFKADLKRMLNNTRSNQRIFGGLAGYIICLEYGELTGIHAHCIFFFDGSLRQKDAAIAEQFGQYWTTTITHGKGRYFNCHRSRNKYKRLCIGRIEHDDHAMRETLLKCVAYITKPGQCLVYREFEQNRSFMRSDLPSIPDVKRGRPRNNRSHDKPPKAA